MNDIRIGNESNIFYVNSKRVNSVIVDQHIGINAQFKNIFIFVQMLNHEYLHTILNTVVDNTCNTSMMLDNIDTYGNGYSISWLNT